MTDRYIRHITLTTGHIRDSYPDEVGPEIIEVIGGLLTAICAGDAAESVPIPNVGAYSLSGRCSGRCLVATVHADSPPSVVVATIGVALHSRCGAALWRGLHTCGRTPLETRADRCPPEPWVAAALNEDIAQYPEAAHWLGDFERCLGWGFAAWRAREV